MAGTLFIVATPIGNLEDISARAIRVLGEVSLIAAEDTRRTNHLLQRFGVTTRCTSFHEHNAKSKAPDLVGRLLGGESIALVTDAGTPGISDPGQDLVRLARDAGVSVIPVPGASAVTAALSVCGFNGDAFIFLGFPPSKGTERRRWFERLEAAREVVPLAVFYEAPHRIRRTLDEVSSRLGGVRVFIGRELTKAHEEHIVGLITEIADLHELGEFACVLEFGGTTNIGTPPSAPDASAMWLEFCHMTTNSECSRRQAIAALSRKYRLSARAVYAMVESAKVSPV